MIVTLYAGVLGLMAIAIGFPIGQLRGKLKVSLGDGGDQRLLLAIRRHGNFMEWVPFALLLIALLENAGVSKWAVHLLGAGLVLARLCHAMGLKHDSIEGAGRLVGAAGTALIIIVASVWLLVRFATG
jgi:uncharacterized membrane protein YecN with MAPEG domain